MEEILLIDKPTGMTSFDAIRVLRRKLGIKKMGHAGTLDPMASGLLIVGIGEGTKKLDTYLKLSKCYEAVVRFGERTDTGDMEGEVLERGDTCALTQVQVEKALASMVGTLELPVPAYSAIKVAGQPLYKRVRKGEPITPPSRTMDVRAACLVQFEQKGERVEAQVQFDVGSGTYIRSLAEELGRRVGLPATLAGLRRTSIGDFNVADAQTLDEL